MQPNGEGVVHLSTRKPVKEPYLDFVVELRWPSGRVLRNYTVLFDLPLYSGEAAAVPAPAATVSSEDSPRTETPQEAEKPWRATPSYTGDSYRVVRGDTLWGIASRLRAENASVQQTMLALHRLNPEAFIRGNINLLRAGAVLSLPDRSDVEQLSLREAISEVRTHNEAWRQGEGQIDRRSTDDDEYVSDSGVLRISGADEGEDTSIGEGLGGSGGESTGGLSPDGTLDEDQRIALERENEDLRSRLADMEAQVDTAERLIAIQDDDMAALQDSDLGEDQTLDEEPVGDDYQQDSATADSTEGETTPAKQKPAPPSPPEPSLLDKILSNVVAVGAGLAALIALALFLVFRRRGDRDEEIELPPLSRPAQAAVVDRVPEATGSDSGRIGNGN